MPRTKKTAKEKEIKTKLIGEIIESNTKEAFDLYSKSRFGEVVEGKIKYSLPEALFLAEKKKISVYCKNKKISFSKFFEKAREIDKKIQVKYAVFKDIRNKGYVVKTALKFGAEFRVYDKGKKPGEEHAKWILFPVSESQEFSWHDFSAKNRVAHSTKKNLLIGIVDEEGSITYYQVSWIRP